MVKLGDFSCKGVSLNEWIGVDMEGKLMYCEKKRRECLKTGERSLESRLADCEERGAF